MESTHQFEIETHKKKEEKKNRKNIVDRNEKRIQIALQIEK